MISIDKLVLSAMGLCAPRAPVDHRVCAAQRRVRAAVFQHQRIVENATSASLDIICRQQVDDRPEQMVMDADRSRETIAEMLGRMK